MKIANLPAAVLLACCLPASAQVNGVGEHPYLGWSSFSQQTLLGNFLTQANMVAQSDALAASGLQQHGFNYINLDSGWMGSFDAYGRPIPNQAIFPDIAVSQQDRLHQARCAGIHGLRGRPVRLLGSGLHQAGWSHARFIRR
jgi:hypothetical protein